MPVCVVFDDSQPPLACVVLAFITLAMWLSPEFVNNLVAVLNVLASPVATALDTLNFALAVDRNSESDPRMAPRAPRNSRHGLRPRSASRQIGRAHRLIPGLGPWTLLRPGVCLNCHLLGKHVVKSPDQEETMVFVPMLLLTDYRHQEYSLPTGQATTMDR